MTIYINYILSDKTPGKYKAENVIIDDQDDSLIRFNWTITRNVTKVSGILSCLVCAKKTDEEGNEINHWNTDIFRLLSVSEGMENDLVIQEQYPDVITSLIQNVNEHDAKLLEFSGLNNRVTDLENNVNEHDAKLLEFSGLDTRVTDVENNVNELKSDIEDLNNAVFVKDDVLSSVECTKESKRAYGQIGDTITIQEVSYRALLSFSPIIGKTYRVKFNQIGNGYGLHAVFICDSNNKILSVYDGEGTEGELDKWYNFEIDILVNETNAHVVYVQAQYASVLDVKVHEIIKTDSKEVRIQDLTNRVVSLEEVNRVLPKPILIMRFDAWNTTDGRFELLKQYGFTATVGPSDSKEQNIVSQEYGLDMGVYRNYGAVTSVYGSDAFSDTPSGEILQAWDNYVRDNLSANETQGIYKPTAWLCTQQKSCVGLVTALKKYGVKMASGYMPDFSTTSYLTDTFDFNKSCEGLYPSTYDSIVAKLEKAISEGKGLCVSTHGILDTEEEANANYSITRDLLVSFFEIVKSKVDAGELLVLNYRQLYSLYNKYDAEAYDFARIISMMNAN